MFLMDKIPNKSSSCSFKSVQKLQEFEGVVCSSVITELLLSVP